MTDLLPPQSGLSARRAQTRQRLMTAAVGVFAERGIIGASVEEICERAGFTRGAFYSNFSDKDELVLALLRHEIDLQYAAAEHAVEVMRAAAGEGHPAEQLVSLALAAFEEQGRSGRDWVLTQQELLLYAARVPRVREQYQVFAAESERHFSTLIGDAIAHAGLEFTVSFPDAVALLAGAHSQVHTSALLTGVPADSSLLRVLLLSLTRPVADASPAP